MGMIITLRDDYECDNIRHHGNQRVTRDLTKMILRLVLAGRFVHRHFSNTCDCFATAKDPHVSIVTCEHKFAADAHVDTADKHHSAGQKTPKEQIELCSLRLIIYDDMLTVFRVVETVKSCPARVVGTIPAISVIKVHTLHRESIDAAFLVLQYPCHVEDDQVLLPRNEVLVFRSRPLNPPVLVRPVERIFLGDVVVVGDAKAFNPGSIDAIRRLDRVHLLVDLDV